MHLHIGGQQSHPGWKILNIHHNPNVDYVGNAADLSMFENNSIKRIYASHVLEHFSYQKELNYVLNEWYRVLEKGGCLMLSVPNLAILCQLYSKSNLSNEERFYIMRVMFGGQVDSYDYHKVGFDFDYLYSILKKAGFEKIYQVQDFYLFRDCSRIKFLGDKISLNVKATK
jgi:predicted SAM-dependent methyltransferase